MPWIWIIIFIASLVVMLKGADWFLNSSERLGLAIGLSPFVIGVTIIGMGTSLPELVSALFALSGGALDVPVANAVGSNIANILLIIGIAAIIGRRLVIAKDLINLDLPLLATSTALFFVIAMDRIVTFPEALILLIAHVVYILYSIFYKDDESVKVEDILVTQQDNTEHALEPLVKKDPEPRFRVKDVFLILLGGAALVFGAQYLIEAVVNLSATWNIATGVIAVTAVAFGTSLPELLVSGMAAYKGKAEVAMGNIFGSNVFNLLVVVGIPALFKTLIIDEKTFTIGLPFLGIATLLFIISGISRKMHHWEGAFYILIYIVFIAKLFGLF